MDHNLLLDHPLYSVHNVKLFLSFIPYLTLTSRELHFYGIVIFTYWSQPLNIKYNISMEELLCLCLERGTLYNKHTASNLHLSDKVSFILTSFYQIEGGRCNMEANTIRLSIFLLHFLFLWAASIGCFADNSFQRRCIRNWWVYSC
jgi:hypothetical protein